MAMHEPYTCCRICIGMLYITQNRQYAMLMKMEIDLLLGTWIVCTKAEGHPAAFGHTNSVTLGRVHQVESGRIAAAVKVPGALSHHKEVVAMQMDGVVLCSQDACALQYQLHTSIEGNPRQPRSHLWSDVRWLHCTCVVERARWLIWEGGWKHSSISMGACSEGYLRGKEE
ncbi:hypothetical protein L7F22_036840 [Adiantum nelumboides]|nr:hypothetical protein [Adiantum nelumboides]